MCEKTEDTSGLRSAFRDAEKQYRLQLRQSIRLRKGRKQYGRLHVVPTDTTGVLDPRASRQGAFAFTEHRSEDGKTLLTLSTHPGFVLLPNALSPEEELHLRAAALTQYPEPPANTNHTRQHGSLAGLWDAARKGLFLGAEDHGSLFWSAGHENAALDGIRSRRWVSRGDGPTAQKLLMKLRWCTLGPQFDWTARVYDREHPYRPLPAQLHALACRLALSAAKFLPDRAAVSWDPDVALVNYYHEGDTLGGHRDDVEQDQTAPIVAISLGCDAIFLLGGQTKDETPVALRLRSGDAVVMAGPARMCYHGIPRVLREAGAADSRGAASGGVGGGDEGSAAIAEHMCGTRINISIRASR